MKSAAASSTLAQLHRRYRLHARQELYDESGSEPLGWAIYTLSDPRELRQVRYVGQTTAPRRRFLQHLNHAQLWVSCTTANVNSEMPWPDCSEAQATERRSPDGLPWWFAQPKLRPLYTWIRELYADGDRLPVMVVSSWQFSVAQARHAERAKIYECLSHGRHLLNVEFEILGNQFSLL